MPYNTYMRKGMRIQVIRITCSSIDEMEIRDRDDLVGKIEKGVRDAREGRVMSIEETMDGIRKELGLQNVKERTVRNRDPRCPRGS